MYRFLVASFLFCLFEHSNAYCCFREPSMLSPKCGCPDFDTPCGLIQCPTTCATDACGCSQPACPNVCPNCGPSFCDCGLPACSCYRDTSNVCLVCDNPSPICSCLKTVSEDCGCEDMRSFIYFPEVEYPVVAIEIKPFYYSGCWCY